MTIKAPFYIPSLDGIRVVAFSIVFLAHAGLGQWIPAGFGVTIFFFLSGYLITTLIRREYEKFGNLDFKLFYTRRILRIWPSFYLTLIIATGLASIGLLPGSLELPAVLIQFFHIANYGVMNGWTAMTSGSISADVFITSRYSANVACDLSTITCALTPSTLSRNCA